MLQPLLKSRIGSWEDAPFYNTTITGDAWWWEGRRGYLSISFLWGRTKPHWLCRRTNFVMLLKPSVRRSLKRASKRTHAHTHLPPLCWYWVEPYRQQRDQNQEKTTQYRENLNQGMGPFPMLLSQQRQVMEQSTEVAKGAEGEEGGTN